MSKPISVTQSPFARRGLAVPSRSAARTIRVSLYASGIVVSSGFSALLAPRGSGEEGVQLAWHRPPDTRARELALPPPTGALRPVRRRVDKHQRLEPRRLDLPNGAVECAPGISGVGWIGGPKATGLATPGWGHPARRTKLAPASRALFKARWPSPSAKPKKAPSSANPR